MNERHFGARLTSGGTTFRLWAQAARRVDLVLEQQSFALTRGQHGSFETFVPEARAGARYKFRIDDEIDVPDPASRFQPDDMFGPSEVIDHKSFTWRAMDWRGRPWHETVLLEAHVGAFTQEGTYLAMIEHLDHLVETGITALELLPLADFAGRRNWGYDGVLWYAPDSVYGRPEDLKRLIDEAHLRSMMVFLDVVYNHFGPEGNFLSRYAPEFFTDAQTPWGSAIDYSVPQVRAFAIENALYWVDEYRFDGLRFDAVNHIVDAHDDVPLLHELSAAVGGLAKETGRHIHLVLENGDNVASLLDPAEDPPRGKYRAQWNDDYHHAFHVLLTSETRGYYGDYPAPLTALARSLGSGFVYQGEVSTFWGNKPRGEPSGGLAPTAFVNFLQNHDQIGNRAFGDRLENHVKPEATEAALAVTLLAPATPMLFMGEEWGSKVPFPFFCDFNGALANAVRNGRRAEYAWAYASHGDDVPDPLDEATFRSAILDWDNRTASGRLALVRELLAIRRRHIMPHLAQARFGEAHAADSGLLSANWHLSGGARLWLTANLSDHAIASSSHETHGTSIWGEPRDSMTPWSVLWQLQQR